MTCVDDLPADLVDAIAHAHRILDWYENMAEDDIPPQHIWAFSEAVDDWFEELRLKRKRETDDTPSDMIQNEDPRIKALRRS